MKDSSSKLIHITKEFDELVKIQNSISNPEFNSIGDLFNIFKTPLKEIAENQKRLYSLPQDQYSAVVNANLAIETFGKGEIGMKIYNQNKAAYFISRKVNSLFNL